MFEVSISLIGLALLCGASAWLARRAWRSRRSWVRWVGGPLLAVAVLGLAAVLVLGVAGLVKLYAPQALPAPSLTVAGTSDQVARGEHVASVACAGCHAATGDLPLSGGRNMADEMGLPLGDLYPPNITSAAIAEHTDGELFRAVRAGLARDGRPTLMAIAGSRFLNDDDLLAVIAYLRHSQPAPGRTPPFRPSLLLALLAGGGLISFDALASASAETPARGATADYGRYVLDYMGCRDCHGQALDGQVPPPAPPGPDLTAALARWTRDDFFTAMRTGVTPAGRQMGPVMPWRTAARLDDDELEALYLFLRQAARPPQ